MGVEVSGKKGTVTAAASVDLSGRHLERLPSSLFSTLHLSSINLSHNLLTHSTTNTTTTTTALKRRQTGRSRRKRDHRRRRRQECTTGRPGLNTQGTKTHLGTKQGLRDDEGQSGDSGLPVEEDVLHRSDPDGESQGLEGITRGSTLHNHQQEGLGCGNTQSSPRWSSLEEELQAKLRLRKPQNPTQKQPSSGSGLYGPPGSCIQPSEVHPRDTQPSSSSSSSISSTVNSVRPRGEGGGAQGGYKDTSSSSSGVDETDGDSDSEGSGGGATGGGGGGEGGAARGAAARTLGALHHLRHFQQLQVLRKQTNTQQNEIKL